MRKLLVAVGMLLALSLEAIPQTTNPSEVFTFPIPAGCIASIQGSNVVYTCTVTPPPPTLSLTTPVTLPQAKVGVAYSANLAALTNVTGGVPPYKFSATGTASWWSLSLAGIVTGTPTAAGTFGISFTVTDSSLSMKGKKVSGGKANAPSAASRVSVHVSH